MSAVNPTSQGPVLLLPLPAPFPEMLLQGMIGGITLNSPPPDCERGEFHPRVALYTTGGTEGFAMEHNRKRLPRSSSVQKAVVGLGVLSRLVHPSSKYEVSALKGLMHPGRDLRSLDQRALSFCEGATHYAMTELTRLVTPIPLSVLKEANPKMGPLGRPQMIDGSVFAGAMTYAAGSQALRTNGQGSADDTEIPVTRDLVAAMLEKFYSAHGEPGLLSIIPITVGGKTKRYTAGQLIAEIRARSPLGNRFLDDVLQRLTQPPRDPQFPLGPWFLG